MRSRMGYFSSLLGVWLGCGNASPEGSTSASNPSRQPLLHPTIECERLCQGCEVFKHWRKTLAEKTARRTNHIQKSFPTSTMNHFSLYTRNYRYKQLSKTGLSDYACEKLYNLVSIKSYDRDDAINTQGNSNDYLIMVISGIVAPSVAVSDKVTSPIEIYAPGTWFGENSIIKSQLDQTNYRCLAPAELLRIPATEVRHYLDAEPRFAEFLSRSVAAKLQRSSEMLMLIKYYGPAARVVLGLAKIAEYLYESRTVNSELESVEKIDICVTQEKLAMYLGVSRTLFSEYVGKLQAAGWLDTHYKRLTLHNIPVWKKVNQHYMASYAPRSDSDFDQLVQNMESSRLHAAELEYETSVNVAI